MTIKRDFSGSLTVENVQTLATKNLKHIPPRYVRPELESDVVSTDESLEIPLIDFSRLLDQQFACEELAKFHAACQDWGFFQLINHGMSEEVIEKMKIDTYQFFKLSLEEKKAYSQLPNSVEGYGQAFVTSEEQKLDWGDMLFYITLPVHGRNMSIWPTSPTSYRDTLGKYATELHKVAVRLLGMMAKNLGFEPEKLTNMFEIDGYQGLRMNYYPPCPIANKVLGLSPHSDATGLTLLLQVNEVQGLQIRKNGIWIPVKPIAGALTVNIGDVIEMMTNGIYKSIEHRAVINSEKERLSIAAFHDPRHGITIGPIQDLVKDKQEKYKTIDYDEYLRQAMTTKLDGKRLLDNMKVQAGVKRISDKWELE
ncbi:hypothetical protein AQUCO_03900155v1 [Aquilegia coerulea]|uniref:Fe2OG dioxygenase domain-containing protein n=1 Tax=Aquilegia coerulea TaxID=218851 RepID=A0A2G5CT62_AQUCA|nr:hypothetical protein AQUCO_03900155v1 [Aquilegia coerulea]